MENEMDDLRHDIEAKDRTISEHKETQVSLEQVSLNEIADIIFLIIANRRVKEGGREARDRQQLGERGSDR